MSMKEFIDDFKEMIKTKNYSPFHQKYVVPFLNQCKVILLKIWDLILEYTPKLIAFLKTVWDKIYAMIQDLMKKKEPPQNPPSPPTPPTQTPPTNPPA